jgi:hypothetical protein
MEFEYLNPIYSDTVDYLVSESESYGLNFICNKCFNIHHLSVNMQHSYNVNMRILSNKKYSGDNDLNIIKKDPEIEEKIMYGLGYLNPYHTKDKIKLHCDNCNCETDHILIDKELSKIISILNKYGYETKFSCSGHGDLRCIPYICLINNDKTNKLIEYIKINDTNKIFDISIMDNKYTENNISMIKVTY